MKRSIFLSLLAASLFLGRSATSQSVRTEPVGFTTNTLLGNSDSFISLPFIRPAAFVGGIQSASGTTITVSGTPWTANQFVYNPASQINHYYALIGPASTANPKEGHTFPIVGNTTNTLTVQLSQDDLGGIPANAQLSVIPNWTLATAFPPADQNVSFTPTTSTSLYKTQVRVPDTSAPGINLPYITYFFSNNVDGTTGNIGWRLVGDNTTNHGDDALLPDSYFVVRNQNGAPTLPLVSLGSVLLKKLTVPLLTSASSAQDNPVSLVRPLDMALNATGLNATDGSFVANDQLLLFNNAEVGFDKSPSAIYYQDTTVPNGRWRLTGDNVTDHGGDLIAMGTGLIIRKATTANGQTAFWTNSFPLQALSAVSRKTHGSAGDFDIDLPLSGQVGIECRNPGNGGTHQVVITFANPVTIDGATVTSGSGSISSSSVFGSVVTVNLTGVANAQTTVVTLLQANDGVNRADVAVRMGVLAGDTNGDSFVNSGDSLQTRNRSGQATGTTNFRSDINVDGFVNSGDTFIVRSRSGTFLP